MPRKGWFGMENNKPQAFSPPELDGADVLSGFLFAGDECWIIQLHECACDLSQSFPDLCRFYSEVCRFEVNGHLCAIVRKRSSAVNDQESLGALLTARELQIATLVAMGCPNKQVADKLHISEWTVATYLRRIFAKLGVESRAAMTYRCASLIGNRESVPGPATTRTN